MAVIVTKKPLNNVVIPMKDNLIYKVLMHVCVYSQHTVNCQHINSASVKLIQF